LEIKAQAAELTVAEAAIAAAPTPLKAGWLARLWSFLRSRRHDAPGVVALAVIALLETFSTMAFAASDLVNAHGIGALTDGRFQPAWDIGLAGIFLPVVIVAWLFGKRRPIRILFLIAVWAALFNVIALVINVLGTIGQHAGNIGAATLLVDAGLLWIMNVVVFALWYWSTDAGGPDRRGTPAERRPDFEFPQQRSKIHGWEGWMPGFHDYLHVAFLISLGFHSGAAEVLSARAKYVNMLQASASVTILLLLVAKAIASFTPAA
jgi:hypothetical protein